MSENFFDFDGDDAEETFKISYKDFKSEEVAEDFHLTKYFLETSRGHKNVFDWLCWLDEDTLLYILECSACLLKEASQFSVSELVDSDSMSQDFSVFALLAYNKEFPKKDVDLDYTMFLYKIMSNSAQICIGLNEGILTVADYGDGSIYGGKLKIAVPPKEEKKED